VREDDRKVVCFIGIGSNVGDSVTNCLEAIERIAVFAHAKISRRSSLYWTEPIGSKDQEWFVNCVIEIETRHTPRELLRILQKIENDMGRIRGDKWGPRTIDLDILFYGQEIVQEQDLIVPHQELHKRRFVLVPLNEIAPYTIHPSYGISIKGLLARVDDKSVVELIEFGSCRFH